jgi:hypothetical protein
MEFLFAAILFFFGAINQDQFNASHTDGLNEEQRMQAEMMLNSAGSIERNDEGQYLIEFETGIVVIDDQTC